MCENTSLVRFSITVYINQFILNRLYFFIISYVSLPFAVIYVFFKGAGNLIS